MSDTDDDYLDEYVQTLLHEAVSGGRNNQAPGHFDYQEELVRTTYGGDDDAERHYDIREVPPSPIIETYRLRRSFSSPAIPEYGRYVRLCPESLGHSGYEDVYKTESAPYEEETDLDARYHEYYRSLRNPHLSDRFMREQVHLHAMPQSPAGDLCEDGDESFEKLDYDLVDASTASTWGQSVARFESSEAPITGGEYSKYGQRDTEDVNEEDEEEGESYLEEHQGESRRPIIRILEEKRPISLPKPKIYPLETSHRSEPEAQYDPDLSRAERHIDYLCNRLDDRISERDDLIEYVKGREHEWMEMSDRLHGEIIGLRQQNTTLLSEKFTKGRRLSKRMADALLKTQQETDRALTTTIERQQKINELRLLVTMQQRYILALEESINQLQMRVDGFQEGLVRQEEQGEGPINHLSPTLTGFPQRHPAEGHRYSSINDVIHCDRSKYIPGKTTDPELATAQVFDFGGEYAPRDHIQESECSRERRVIFNPLEVPYVRGGLRAN